VHRVLTLTVVRAFDDDLADVIYFVFDQVI